MLSEDFEVNVWMLQGSALSPYLVTVMVDAVAPQSRLCASQVQ